MAIYRIGYLARHGTALLGVTALLALVGCQNNDIIESECFWIGCSATLTAAGNVVDCCELDLCTTDLDTRLACCACEPGLYCAPDRRCEGDTAPLPNQLASGCMGCHNGSERENYIGPGIQNPHPFPGARFISCEICHGGDPTAREPDAAHIPRPPEIGDILSLETDVQAYEYFRTHTGVEDFPDYQVNGITYQAIDWLQFVNPGAVPVVEQGRGCAITGCHRELGTWMATNAMTTGAGIASGFMDQIGVQNAIPERLAWYGNTAADYGFRAAEDPSFVFTGDDIGEVGSLLRAPELAAFGDPDGIVDNPEHIAPAMVDDVVATSDGVVFKNQVVADTPLHDLLRSAVGQACGQCHLGDRGSNLYGGDIRSSGCSACHMRYDLFGRSHTRDPNVEVAEPANPDWVAAPENVHPEAHRIAGRGQLLPSGDVILGIADDACSVCHRQTHDTALQFWGVRVDENQDVTNNLQYPSNPDTFQNTANDRHLFHPDTQNQRYQGLNVNQLLTFEDYDGDGQNDIPADIHHERGLACVDCHSGSDTHNGAPGDAGSGTLVSRAEQSGSIACETCHGAIDAYAATGPCIDTQGQSSECVIDRRGQPLTHVTRVESGDYWLLGRGDARVHYVPQTRDVVVDTGRQNPLTAMPVYNPRASYAMGRADGDPDTGIGPQQAQAALVTAGFAHSDRMDCVSCHAAWNTQRFGEYLSVRYDGDPQVFTMSGIDGRRVAVRTDTHEVVYATPVPFFLGVGSRGAITQFAPERQLFFQYTSDIDGLFSPVFAFTDRRGDGNNPGYDGRGPFGALSYGRVMPHTIRGRTDASSEGARQCVACHLNSAQLADFGSDYQAFVTAMDSADIAAIDFVLLQQHIGQNPGNQLNSPFFVHMAAGLGTGLWYFDAAGCPENPLDGNAERERCESSPASSFAPADVAYALDQPATRAGVANAAGHRPAASSAQAAAIAAMRDGAHNPDMPGPLGATLSKKLSDPNLGLILDSWLDADGQPGGQAAGFL